ncbi:MAG: phosphate ABC transporter ATP-binding protein [Chloroflexi bacterium]|uniref:Phosphate ABC transporter ATP-binding protein n=1 Tax=Candidatus Chlorohelix allophototropha TaxID=3003348 RepID=A0A8T7M037_9CHLR|nr:phosphate ABC transporter ATP-binding protein [Chloroflexota bacterium]WJW66047.1 phosphate ABC transporter ATP-binding protein [Chloroflexota bacterium L227-S17]
MIIETKNLSRQVADKILVEDINIQVEQGEVLAIIGPSGAGKTTFLRLLNRLDEPTSGTVYYEGKDYRSLPPAIVRQQIGMVLQSPYLFPGSIAENISFGPRQRGITLSSERISWLLERVGLPGYQERAINNLSGGEAQRVSLARTLANSPKVLLLDEPTSALDSEAEHEVETLLSGIIAEEKLTCLIITHNMAQAARIANRALYLVKGKLASIGTVEEIIHA